MKVIQVIPMFALAGAEIMCENLIYGLLKDNVEVVAVSLYHYHSIITQRLETAGVKIIYLNKKYGFDTSIYEKLYKVLREERPDVVHTHLRTIKYAIPAAIRAKVRCRVYTVHNLAEKEGGKVERLLNKIFFKSCATIPVALSGIIKKSVLETYKLKDDKVPIIFNGVDLGKCMPKVNYAYKEKLKILHIGRFMGQKNHQDLIKAFALFHKKYPQSILQLIGEGEKREETEGLVRALGLLDCVEFLGLQSNVYQYLYEADIFTLTSLYEGMPITLIEAMGTGLPIVATNVGGVPDMLTNEESALLTDVSAEVIAAAFYRLATDEILRAFLGSNAKKRSVIYSNENMTKNYLQIYEVNIK